ncbi:MAG: hypothetical protein H6744_07285 [Deltaproteobacteria bacterium]|nr:hypothetical protein [Deltaproteobacteria bacterium]MCB9786482.1 hypothetical protein [Deltaproteobacteria bacterium]
MPQQYSARGVGAAPDPETGFDGLGAPIGDFTRSAAAAAIGRLARRSGLFCFHFEHRVRLPLPEHWLPEGRPDLGEPPGWQAGVLPESKYQTFRHDLLLGSFHPGHRGKWSAHELCHGLAGFAWKPGATPLFHALAARLAEALPVALWYFLDEAGLARCSQHAGGGPLHGDFCARCEEAALAGPVDDGAAERWLEEGRAFVLRELDAVERSRREGRSVAHRLGPLDLASDGLAYAAAHGPRLGSEEMERYVSAFFAPGQGHHPDLDALSARVLELTDALTLGRPAAPLAGDRWRWITQDLGSRLLEVRADCDGEILDVLDTLIDRLAAEPGPEAVEAAWDAYADLYTEWVLPTPEDVFATGYDLPTVAGRSVRQLAEGVASACPGTWEALDAERGAVMTRFVAQDAAIRLPVGRRFAGWLRAAWPGPLADLATYEASLAHPPAADAEALTLGSAPELGRDEAVALSRGVELLTLGHRVAQGPAGLPVAGEPGRVHLALQRGADGDVAIFELPPSVAAALATLAERPADPASVGLDAAETTTLRAHGIIVPDRWRA